MEVITSLRRCTNCMRSLPETEFHRATTGWRDSGGVKRRPMCRRCLNQWKHDRRQSGVPEELPIAPFRCWLERKQERYAREHGSKKGFAESLGISTKQLKRDLEEQTLVRVATVDSILIHEGSTGLWELYPELYPDLEEVA